MTNKEIALVLNKKPAQINSRANRLGVQISNRIFTDEETQYVKDHAMEMTAREMAEALGKTYEQVHGKLSSLKINQGIKGHTDNRKDIAFEWTKYETPKRDTRPIEMFQKGNMLPLDERYFDCIDDARKAYWLGFLYADGSVSKGQMRLALKTTDKSHLIKLRDAVHSTVEPKFKTSKLGDSYSVTFSRKAFCDSLERKGCVANKSLVLKFPDCKILPEKYHRDFIRGYIDGDGCISFSTKNQTYVVGIVGTREMLISIRDILSNALNISTEPKIRPKGRAFQLMFSGRNQALKICHYLYDGAEDYLDRKREKFELMKTA